MAGMCDVLVHAYDHVDVDEVWRVATKELPDPIISVEPLSRVNRESADSAGEA